MHISVRSEIQTYIEYWKAHIPPLSLRLHFGSEVEWWKVFFLHSCLHLDNRNTLISSIVVKV